MVYSCSIDKKHTMRQGVLNPNPGGLLRSFPRVGGGCICPPPPSISTNKNAKKLKFEQNNHYGRTKNKNKYFQYNSQLCIFLKQQ